MRNLVKYPVTRDEIVDCIRGIMQNHNQSNRIGEMTELLLAEAIRSVERDETPRDTMGLTGNSLYDELELSLADSDVCLSQTAGIILLDYRGRTYKIVEAPEYISKGNKFD